MKTKEQEEQKEETTGAAQEATEQVEEVENNASNEEAQDIQQEETEQEEAPQEEEKSPLELKEEAYNELNNKYLRLYSEFDNFRKRTQKEKLELYKTAGEDLMLALLPIMDDFERGMKSMKGTQEVNAVKEGMQLIYQKMSNILEQKGLKAIEPAVGKELNVDFHEAITQVPAPSKKMKGKIIDEVEKGYLLKDKVIRYTKVVVGQ